MKNLARILVCIGIFMLTITGAYADEGAIPSDVSNVEAVASDSSVTLTWDIATDDTGLRGYFIYYGTESVTGEDETNYTEFVEVENVLEHTIVDLENGTTYYFAMTAVNSIGNESEYYSEEVNATPSGEGEEEVEPVGNDNEAPKVLDAQALTINKVRVEFSEKVAMPAEFPEDAFTIQNNDTLEILDVLSVKLIEGENSVILTTAPQLKDVPYIVTVGIEVEDLVGNPITSGVSDVAVFAGTDVPDSEEPGDETPSEDENPPIIADVESLTDTLVKVTFNEKVVLLLDPTENFEIGLDSDPEEKLEIEKIELVDDDYVVELTTNKQSKVTYRLTVKEVKDKSGNVISEEDEANTETFRGKGESTLLDLVAPENVTGFVSQVLDGMVKLSWKASINSDNDLSGQILYKSTDGKKYDNGTPIDPNATSYNVYGLKQGTEYYFKVTAKDETGNESSGTLVSAILPATGPGLGLVALASLGAGFVIKKKKK